MATIDSSIQLTDNFTNVLNHVLDSVNLTISAMEDLSSTMDSPFDTASLEAAKDSINQATMAAHQLSEAIQNVGRNGSPDIQTPTWNSDTGIEIFNTSGFERYQQEIESVNQMMTALRLNQEALTQSATYGNILPPQAANDMANLNTRIQGIAQRIQQISARPIDTVTPQELNELESLREQLNRALNLQRDIDNAVDNMDVEAANRAYLELSRVVGNTERNIRDNIDEQNNFNESIRHGVSNSNELMRSIQGIIGAYVSIQSIRKVLDVSDELTATKARIDMMNQSFNETIKEAGQATMETDELVNLVYQSAQNARGSFGDMASIVAKFGNNARDAFSSQKEVVDFANLIQKQMTIAGASTEEASNAMLQLSQALGSGVLRGDELNSIFEQAPNLIQSIAKYLNVPIGSIREMASEGQLTADIVKAAIFESANDINKQFENMPMTWNQVFTSMQNRALMAFRPVLNKVNELANNQKFQQMIDGLMDGLAKIANVLLNIMEISGQVAAFFSDNWSVIEPIIMGIVAALGAYLLVSGIINVMNGIMAASEGIKAAAQAMATGATLAETAAQYGLNAALAACPITWIIVLIIALIALFYAAVAAVNKFAGTSVSATGIICGAFATYGAFIYNQTMGILDLVFGVINALVNPFLDFANFIGNVFTNPVSSIIYLFQGMADNVLGIIQKIASALDFVFGSNMADTVQGWRDMVKAGADILVEKYAPEENYEKVIDKLDLSVEGLGINRIAYSDAWNTGYNFGEGIDESISKFNPSSLFGTTDIPAGGIGDSVNDIASNTDSIKNSMDITEEDLKYLRDIAEQEAVNRFTTAEITIEQTNNNNISSEMDLDGIVSGLTDAVDEAAYIIAEGVHA